VKLDINFRKFGSRILRYFEFVIKSKVIILLQVLSFKTNSSIHVRFDASAAKDGTGAQLQRQLSIYALSNYFGFSYSHAEIEQVAVHALDPFQTDILYRDYLDELNSFIRYPKRSDGADVESKFLRIDLLFWNFLLLLLRNRVRQSSRFISILDPYPITEFCPTSIFSIRSSLKVHHKNLNKLDHPYLALHYRQGVGGFAIYPGQNISRETSLSQIEPLIESIIRTEPKLNIVVLTDAPASPTYFKPMSLQQTLWEDTPGYRDGLMTIKPKAFDHLSTKFGVPVQVIRGGNPLEAIEMMAQADYLIMGKSSLSFFGGVLNLSGQVYYPRNFWHRPMAHWQSF